MSTMTVLVALLGFVFLTISAGAQVVTATRIDARPPGHVLDSGQPFDPNMDERFREHWGADGGSTAGPCVIRVPEWIPDHEKTHPSARYYLYYTGHHGSAIKMAWAASITGEWHLLDRSHRKAGRYRCRQLRRGGAPDQRQQR